MKVADTMDRTHNPFGETCWVSCLRENLTISSYGEGLETGRNRRVPRQSLTRQLMFKLWKSQSRLAASRSENRWRILCEVYVKLLIVLIEHWILLTGLWEIS